MFWTGNMFKAHFHFLESIYMVVAFHICHASLNVEEDFMWQDIFKSVINVWTIYVLNGIACQNIFNGSMVVTITAGSIYFC